MSERYAILMLAIYVFPIHLIRLILSSVYTGPVSKAKFKKHLSELNIEELRHELLGLYDKVKEVKNHYAMELGSENDRKRLYDKAKSEIISKYATKSYRRPRRPRIQKINIILRRMKQTAVFKHELIDLYLFDIEQAMVFIAKYGFFSQTLANHITSVYKMAAQLIAQEQMYPDYIDRSDSILSRAELIPDLHWELDEIRQDFFR